MRSALLSRIYDETGEHSISMGEAIITLITAGLGIESAARHVGVDPRTVRRWLSAGRAEIAALDADENADPPSKSLVPWSPYAEFAREVERARSKAEMGALSKILRIGNGEELVRHRRIEKPRTGEVIEETEFAPAQWTALAWYLERTRPDLYARRTYAEPPPGEIEAAEREPDAEEIETVARALVAWRRKQEQVAS